MITYTLEELYQVRTSPLANGVIPEALQALLQPAKIGRWNNVRRHDAPPVPAPGKQNPSPPKPSNNDAAVKPVINAEGDVSSPEAVLDGGPGGDASDLTPKPPVQDASSALVPEDSPAMSVTNQTTLPELIPPPLHRPPDEFHDLATPNGQFDGPPPGWSAPSLNPVVPPVNHPPPRWAQPSVPPQRAPCHQPPMTLDDQMIYDEWDSPLPASGDIENFTLGDIRAAEAAVEGMGVPLHVYIDRVKRQTGGGTGCPQPMAPPPQSMPPPNQNCSIPASNSLLGRGRQDIFFNENGQYGESKFMSFFERSRRNAQPPSAATEDSRLNGNAKPFYPSRYSSPGFDDPRKYAPFLPNNNANKVRPRPMGMQQAQQAPAPQAPQRDIQSLLMRLARQPQSQEMPQPYYDQGNAAPPAPPPPSASSFGGNSAAAAALNKVSPQQLLQVIQNMSKNSNQELTARQKELLRFAMVKITQLQQQQQHQQSQHQQPPHQQAPPPPQPVMQQPPPMFHTQQRMPPPPPPQSMGPPPPMMSAKMTLPQPTVGGYAPPSISPGTSNAALETYREMQPAERITAIAEALQRTLQQQKAKGMNPTASQKQALFQVLNALQRLKAQKNAAGGGVQQQSGESTVNDLYGAVYAAAAAGRKNTDATDQVRKENVGIDE